MAPASEKPTIAELHRFSIRLPRPLWIGVAAVILTVAASALGLGLPIYRRQASIKSIERLNGHVEVQLGSPEWLRKLLGDDRLHSLKIFDQAVGAALINTAGRNCDAASLSGLPELETLYLCRTGVTDSQLRDLCALQKLRVLYLARSDVTDADVCELRSLHGLEVLSLYGTQVSDPCVECLKDLTSLEELDLRATQVTESALKALKIALPGCRILPEVQLD
jgi:hypothetical protein